MRVTRVAAAVVVAVVVVLLGVVQEAEAFVGFGSAVPGGFISYMWWIYLGAMGVAVYKKKLVRYKERRRILLEAEDERQRQKEAAGEVPIPEEEPYDPYYSYAIPLVPHDDSRSLNDLPDEDQREEDLERLLLSIATYLDESGCSLKLLCHLRERPQQERSLAEDGLVELFSNGTAQVLCTQAFPSCGLQKEQLRGVFALTTSLIGGALHLVPSWV
ncbi:uncharacterized protein LOC123501344 [Portunus trituberculatus]|uniref:uncharacterized protein LOC123501344 n=1 Tax=Portunus trituberculatus TaxID=210409 RepID=UPI001E1D0FB2|nr:uncharacterized protein LOC123501344 [Portunus trituberculatus]